MRRRTGYCCLKAMAYDSVLSDFHSLGSPEIDEESCTDPDSCEDNINEELNGNCHVFCTAVSVRASEGSRFIRG